LAGRQGHRDIRCQHAQSDAFQGQHPCVSAEPGLRNRARYNHPQAATASRAVSPGRTLKQREAGTQQVPASLISPLTGKKTVESVPHLSVFSVFSDFLSSGFLSVGFVSSGFLSLGFLSVEFLSVGVVSSGFLSAGFFSFGLGASCFFCSSVSSSIR